MNGMDASLQPREETLREEPSNTPDSQEEEAGGHEIEERNGEDSEEGGLSGERIHRCLL